MFESAELRLRQQALINGQWLTAESGETASVFNPATGDLIGSVPMLSRTQIETCIQLAEKSFYSWRDVNARHRCELLAKWAQAITVDRERIAKILTMEQGKPLHEALGEVDYATSYINWYAQHALLEQGSMLPFGQSGDTMLVTKEPIGVCAAITPWNFPAAMITRKVAPALAAGCTMIVKPALNTPFTALALAELALDVGFPAGVLNIVTGDAEMLGSCMTQSHTVRKLSFTGSTKVGQILMAACATNVKRLSLELGGNAPFIVCEDADIERAVQGAMDSKFRNAGQTCVCANAFYVHESVYDAFSQQLADRVNKLQLGKGSHPDTHIGPLINNAAIEKVESLLQDAISKGAKVVCGGERWEHSSKWFKPTVLTAVTTDMRCVQEEIFGPVAPLVKYRSEPQLLEHLRRQSTGLAAYFYSSDLSRIKRISKALEVGMIGVNTGLISDAAVPFGGVKSSGIGREGGKQGLEEYQETKYTKICD